MERWLNTRQAADYLTLSTHYLMELRRSGGGPAYVVTGKRRGIRYNVEDLDAWMSERRRARQPNCA